MKKLKKLDVEYDQVVVLDFLSETERRKHQITIELESLFKANRIGIMPVYLNNRNDLESIMNTLIQLAKSGKRFMIHFVAHGNVDGIGFKETAEFISWVDLEPLLISLNKECQNTVVLNMTTCFGLHGIKTVNPFSSDKPFFGLIGYTEKLKIVKGKQANSHFYTSVFNGLQFNEALKALQLQTNDLRFHCITSEGYSFLKNKGE
ncbi:hypothetical protein [Algoriphagus sp.]|uniref:hypothetical protein n=1 Tax=Algoriphagus sp. TaxID=1872435 RepID=UPI00328D2409